jgi:hydrogenase maturation protein HypF
MQKTFKIVITGRVQGVGFRPHVYILARHFGITGTVSNNEEGVIIYATGTEDIVLAYYNTVIDNPSKASRIVDHSMEEVTLVEFIDFRIIPSEKGNKLNLQLTPDFAICESCSEDMFDSDNRRFWYPFTTCVHCGPRWSITSTFPFERENTSMATFEMCEDCQEEYSNAEDRRFHSQTNSCPKCGINYRLENAQGQDAVNLKENIFKMIASLLMEGNIIAIKNTGGYLLCCDATSAEAVQKLRNKKNRPDKPFALMYPSMGSLKDEFTISESEEKLLTSAERPIVIIPSENYIGNLAAEAIAPGLNQLGVMLPYTGILRLLASDLEFPIVATSGNLHGSPIISDETVCTEILGDVADYFFHHNLNIIHPQDDSVVKFSVKSGHPIMFRRARGYAPNFFRRITSDTEKILALGGHLKSSIAYVPNDFIYISEYLGMLDHLDVYERFTQTVSKFIRIFESEPEVVLTDMHPEYQSSRYGKELAKKYNIPHLAVQHHKAHFAAAMGEYDLMGDESDILGVVWDGTGYGEDGNIWGGEFFRYRDHQISRLAHFEYFDWLAGNKMAKEPRLSLFSLMSSESVSEIKQKFSKEEFKIYTSLKKSNTLKTSSVGRLFDAVASLLDICDFNNYEGEAAILLENSVSNYEISDCVQYGQMTDNEIIPTHEIWKNLYEDFRSGVQKGKVILNFLYTLACMVKEVATQHKVKEIAFSGGVFQNAILTDMIIDIVGSDYKLYFHRELAPNDENISFGQLMYYVHCVKEQDRNEVFKRI